MAIAGFQFCIGGARHARVALRRVIEHHADARVRGLAVAAIYAGVLVACGGVEGPRQIPLEFRLLEVEVALVWEAAVRSLNERGFNIQTSDREAGVIETGWFSINPDYAATFFVIEREDRYSTCGKPGPFRAFRGKQARLVLTLRAMPRGESALRAEASFRTQRFSHIPLWPRGPLGEVACSSRGRLEEETKLQIQLRALAAQMERLRHGTP